MIRPVSRFGSVTARAGSPADGPGDQTLRPGGFAVVTAPTRGSIERRCGQAGPSLAARSGRGLFPEEIGVSCGWIPCASRRRR